ncbi:DNA sulfur modification protein DndB [Paenibacillus polymyxa]|uniref:DNA sulfur modification protein DndB n=1 Tax=Paenibacillus polymyxa TaxID=1406 RepID=UPI00287F8D39|nr:DNA sulfur modification protein DndB [Paenibacillus polymyxa]
MKIDRSELERAIYELIENHKTERKKILAVNDRLNSFGVPYGVFTEIMTENKHLSTISSSLLCVITEVLNGVFGQIDPLDYFTAEELRVAKEHVANEFLEEKLELPLEFEAIQIDERSYSSKISVKLLNKMFESQMIIYDPRSQRGMKFKGNRDDGIIETPIVNRTSVNKIADKLINNDYLTDTIRLNVYSQEAEPIEWIPQEHTLIINKGATISILDGFHRLQAVVKALSAKKDLDFWFELSIRTYDAATSAKFFAQINTINVLSKERKKELGSEEKSSYVVKELQQNPNSELKGIRIASTTKPNREAGQLTTFSIINLGIEKTFNPTTYLEYQKTASYLIKYFGILISIYVDEFIENPKNYYDTYINHPLMFLGYLVVAKRMYDKYGESIDPDLLKNTIDDLNLKEDAQLIDMLEAKRVYTSVRAQNGIIKHFENIVKEV